MNAVDRSWTSVRSERRSTPMITTYLEEPARINASAMATM